MLLLQQGASASVRNVQGDNALLLSAAAGRHELCKILIRKYQCSPFLKDHEGKSAIDRAVASGYKELANTMIFECCVRNKAKVNIFMLIAHPDFYEIVFTGACDTSEGPIVAHHL